MPAARSHRFALEHHALFAQIWEDQVTQFVASGNEPYFECTNKGCDPTKPIGLTLATPSSPYSQYTASITFSVPKPQITGRYVSVIAARGAPVCLFGADTRAVSVPGQPPTCWCCLIAPAWLVGKELYLTGFLVLDSESRDLCVVFGAGTMPSCGALTRLVYDTTRPQPHPPPLPQLLCLFTTLPKPYSPPCPSLPHYT